MSQDESFRDLCARWAAGDQQAGKVIIERYEPHIRRVAVRSSRTREWETGAEADDICQSVICDLLRSEPKQLFDTPEQFLAYVAKAISNKNQKHRRRMAAQRRDADRVERKPVEEFEVVDDGVDPVQQTIVRDLWEAIHSMSSQREWQIYQLRHVGHSWPVIAAQLGAKPDAVRVQYDRLLGRVYRQLQFEI